jgi:pimeloyl-ACP methyl ester carboxylesterase
MSHAIPGDVVHASVVAGGLCTPYLAAGRGPAVILLSKAPAWIAGVLSAVPRHFHVLAPVPATIQGNGAEGAASHDSIRADFPGWIDGFLDALGVTRAWIVTDARYADVSLAYSVAAPDRVRAVVVLQEDGQAPADDPARITRSLIGFVASLDGR